MMWDDGSEMLWSIEMVGREGDLHENGANCNVKKKLTRIDVESFFSLFFSF